MAKIAPFEHSSNHGDANLTSVGPLATPQVHLRTLQYSTYQNYPVPMGLLSDSIMVIHQRSSTHRCPPTVDHYVALVFLLCELVGRVSPSATPRPFVLFCCCCQRIHLICIDSNTNSAAAGPSSPYSHLKYALISRLISPHSIVHSEAQRKPEGPSTECKQDRKQFADVPSQWDMNQSHFRATTSKRVQCSATDRVRHPEMSMERLPAVIWTKQYIKVFGHPLGACTPSGMSTNDLIKVGQIAIVYPLRKR